MNTLRKSLIFLLLPLFMGFSIEPDGPDLTGYRPILLKKDDLARSIQMHPPRDFSQPGKIYLYHDYILIVDFFTGVHVIDNQNPAQPIKTGFILVPGIMDVAMRNNVLYADNAIDLVAIDFSQYPVISPIDRMADVFPEPVPPDLSYIPWSWSAENRPENTVIVGWRKK